MSKKYGVKTKRVPKTTELDVPTIQLIYPVSDTLEALEEDYLNIGYSEKEAAAAARNAFSFDKMEIL